MWNEQRVFVLEIFQLLQDRFAFVVEAVVAAPLQITDLDRDLGELESVRIDLDGFELLHAHARLELEAELGGEGDDFFFQIEQELDRYVKEVAAAAGGIEHGDGRRSFFGRRGASRDRMSILHRGRMLWRGRA